MSNTAPARSSVSAREPNEHDTFNASSNQAHESAGADSDLELDEVRHERRRRSLEFANRNDESDSDAHEEVVALLNGDEKVGGDARSSDDRVPSSGRRRRSKKRRTNDAKSRDARGSSEESERIKRRVEEGKRLSSESGDSEFSLMSLPENSLKTPHESQARPQGALINISTELRSQSALITIFLTLAFLSLLFSTYSTSNEIEKQNNKPVNEFVAQSRHNGTHEFAPTTILISLDGFRADYLDRGLTPRLRTFIGSGVSPRYMNPSFPSLTFPNHFTLVTGLYPEAHGVVANTFWDPSQQRSFSYMDAARSMTPEWWNAEPIWETAELQDAHAAIHMWPGSEAHIGSKAATYISKFNSKEPLDRKVHQIFQWLDLPGPNDTNAIADQPRPQLIAAYVPNVDADGHLYGPNSTYVRSTIAEVDGMLGALFDGIAQRNLTEIVNVVIVSDHGMATTSNDRLIQYDDLIDTTIIEHTDGWPLYGLRPYNSSDENIASIHSSLLAKSKLPEHQGHFEVYLRDTTMPKEYHFTNNQRIAPIWIVPEAGWAIVTRADFNIPEASARGETYHPKGMHGYNHTHPLMRAIFAARGPAFPPRAQNSSRLATFQNTELYNLICDSLGITPAANNGTWRLPLTGDAKYDDDTLVAVGHGSLLDVVDGKVIAEGQEHAAGEDISAQILPPEFPGIFEPPVLPTIRKRSEAMWDAILVRARELFDNLHATAD